MLVESKACERVEKKDSSMVEKMADEMAVRLEGS